MPRTDIPPGWDERTILTTFLDYVRATVHAKCEHLAEDEARRAPLPGSPLMTLAGLVNHLRWVEYYYYYYYYYYYWFQVMLVGEEDHGPWTEEDPDREMRIAVAVPIAQLLDEYQAHCARYRDLVASWIWIPRPSGLSMSASTAALAITGEASPFALRSTRNRSEESNAPAAARELRNDRPVSSTSNTALIGPLNWAFGAPGRTRTCNLLFRR